MTERSTVSYALTWGSVASTDHSLDALLAELINVALDDLGDLLVDDPYAVPLDDVVAALQRLRLTRADYAWLVDELRRYADLDDVRQVGFVGTNDTVRDLADELEALLR
jgi:hypothetical protein